MYIEPNCDMPWEVYLDWLQDQGNQDLRFICASSLIATDEYRLYHHWSSDVGFGQGYCDNSYIIELLQDSDRLYFSYGAGSTLSSSMFGNGSI